MNADAAYRDPLTGLRWPGFDQLPAEIGAAGDAYFEAQADMILGCRPRAPIRARRTVRSAAKGLRWLLEVVVVASVNAAVAHALIVSELMRGVH